jgi:hypothetical protein
MIPIHGLLDALSLRVQARIKEAHNIDKRGDYLIYVFLDDVLRDSVSTDCVQILLEEAAKLDYRGDGTMRRETREWHPLVKTDGKRTE